MRRSANIATIDIIGNRRLARAAAPPRDHRLEPSPSGGRQEGGSQGGREDDGAYHPRCAPLPTSPRWGEASETVWSPTLMAFLSDNDVYE